MVVKRGGELAQCQGKGEMGNCVLIHSAHQLAREPARVSVVVYGEAVTEAVRIGAYFTGVCVEARLIPGKVFDSLGTT